MHIFFTYDSAANHITAAMVIVAYSAKHCYPGGDES